MKNNHKYQLFLPSGCLTLEAIRCYLSGTLSINEKSATDQHLSQCEFCRDTLEGSALIADRDQHEKIISGINKKIENKLKEKSPAHKSRTVRMNTRLFYVSVAASIVIIVGLYFIMNNLTSDRTTKLAFAEGMDIEEQLIPPKPPTLETPTEFDPAEVPSEITKKEESREDKVKEPATEAPSVPKVSTPAEKEQASNVQVRKIPETILHSQREGEFIEGDDAVLYEQEISTPMDIASSGPIEYFISGITFFNELPEREAATGMATGLNQANEIKRKSTERRKVATAVSVSERTTESIQTTNDLESDQQQTGSQQHFFSLVDRMPEFSDGEAALEIYLRSALRYPESARKAGLEGTVSVSFLIGEDGRVSEAKVNHGPGKALEDEALRVISEMPSWQPALINDEPVSSLLTMPITFRLR
jgi:TonB family protein